MDASAPAPAPPQDSQEIRSLAIARLKRAASLPRRQPRARDQQVAPEQEFDTAEVGEWTQRPEDGQEEYEETLTPARPTMVGHEPGQGQWDASPYTPHDLTAYAGSPAVHLSRSGSTASRSRSNSRSATPSPSPSAFQPGPCAGPLGRSTPSPLPSLGELRQLHRANSAAGRNAAMNKLMGSAPSPSPTPAAQSQALHRAGSLGSSAMLATHSSPGRTREIPRFGINSPSRRRERASRGAGAGRDTARDSAVGDSADEGLGTEIDTGQARTARPRLERSFTVGNGGGEERRSVIGRRMMLRLGTRVADRLEALEHPRAGRVGDHNHGEGGAGMQSPQHPLRADREVSPPITPEAEGTRMHSVLQDDSPTDPHTASAPPQQQAQTQTTPTRHPPSAYLGGMSLAPHTGDTGRAPSRISAMSGDDAFEYEVHLRRSLSEKERRGKGSKGAGAGAGSASGSEAPQATLGSADEDSFDGHGSPQPRLMPSSGPALGDPIGLPSRDRPARPLTTDTQRFSDAPTTWEDTTLLPPMAAFSGGAPAGAGHVSALSASSAGSIHSLDPIARIPFIVPGGGVGDSPGQGARVRTARGVRDRNDSGPKFPVEADDGRGSSGYGTPRAGTSSPGTANAAALPVASASSTASLVSPSTASLQQSPVHLEPPVSASGSAFKEHFDDSTDDEASPASLAVPLRKGSAASWEIVVKDEGPAAERDKVKQDGMAGRLKRSLSRSLSRNKSKSERSTTPLTPSARSSHARASQGSSGSAEHSSQNHSDERAPPPSAYQVPTEHSRKGSQSSSMLSRAPSVKLEPGQISPMPQASPMDPRYNNAKLFPAPGIAPPPLLQQASDSAVPILQSAQEGQQAPPSAAGASASYYELSGQAEEAPPAQAGQSIGKKNWLAEAFFAPTGARFHGKKPSTSSERAIAEEEGATAMNGLQAERREPDSQRTTTSPIQGAPDPSLMTDDGSGRNRIAGHRGLEGGQTPVSAKSQAVLQRLDHILSLAPEDEGRPDVLDDPPRRLVLCAPMLQVVNGHTVKDRFLFLFNDILVIAKPLSDTAARSALDGLFSVKSVVGLEGLSLLPPASEDRPASEAPQRHPVVLQFIETFARDPPAAIKLLYERSQLQGDTATLASLLFKTPELDKEQLGRYLARRDNLPLLRAFIDRFKFQGVRLDEALRVFLLSIRLPAATVDVEAVLNTLAERWVAANQSHITFGKALAAELVMAIMQLNDAINPGSGFGGFAFPNPAISMDDFVGAFRTKDTKISVPTDLLEATYAAVKRESLAQSLPQSQADNLREVIASRMPTRLTHNRWSESTFISIPRPDPRFGVKLHGEGLIFDPPHLDFSDSTEESFRVMGTTLGTRSLLVTRVGANAPLYANLPNAKTFVVERPFMRFTFQLAFVNHLGVKRKYCFSVDSAETRDAWAAALARHVASSQAQRSGRNQSDSIMPGPVWCAAQDAALRVLQDAFIADEKDPQKEDAAGQHSVAMGGNKPFSPPASLRKPKIVRQITGRRISVAKILMPLQKGSGDLAANGDDIQEIDEEPPMPEKAQTGKDIVLLCRQNSILPLVLGLLHAGVEAVAARPQATEFGLFDGDLNRGLTPAI